ncbi:MAG: hypothetical protein SFY80_02470 [Verrucomicrobiota bacterium]|nr:hypothetical protein [Verrucomicrobiota bacterium]
MIAQKLHSKSALFYHAVNLIDFKTYWREQAILSRAELSNIEPEYTRFFSDDTDREIEVFDRTFGNLNDLGKYIAKYKSATPNCYGPITLVFNQDVWATMEDIVITKNTITSANPHRITEEELDLVYSLSKGRYWLNRGYTACEVSSSSSKIPFTHLAYIIVDPLVVNAKSLRQYIWEEINAWQAPEKKFYVSAGRLRERSLADIQVPDLYGKLASWAEKLEGRLIVANEPLDNTVPEDLVEWFSALADWKRRILASWLTYTYNGTIRPIQRGQ